MQSEEDASEEDNKDADEEDTTEEDTTEEDTTEEDTTDEEEESDEIDTSTTSWDFTDSGFSSFDSSSTTTSYNGLQITYGKVNNSQYLLMSNGGTIKIPVAGKKLVSVTACYSYSFKFEDEAVIYYNSGSTNSTQRFLYVHDSDDTEYVTITVSGTSYFNSIEVTDITDSAFGTDDTTYDFTDSAYSSYTDSSSEYTYNNLVIYNGKYHSSTYGMTITTYGYILVPVSGDCTVTVSAGYQWALSYYSTSDSSNTYTQTEGSGSNSLTCNYSYTGGKGYVPIIVTGQTYIASIAIVYGSSTEDESGDDDSSETVEADADGFYNGMEVSSIAENTSYYYDFTGFSSGIANTYSAGLFSFSAGNSNAASYHSATYGIQFKAGNMLTFKVAGDSYIVVGGDNNNSCTDLAATVATADSGAVSPETQTTVTSGHATLANCKTMGDNTVIYKYKGESNSVTLTVNSNSSYIAYICVIPVEKVTVSGTVTLEGTIDGDYKVIFTDGDGETIEATVTSGSYSAELVVGNTYTISLRDSSYSITSPSGATVEVTSETSTLDITASAMSLVDVSGSISFPDGASIPDDLAITFTENVSDEETPHTVTVNEFTTGDDGTTYTASLKTSATYNIEVTGTGVKDYSFSPSTVTTETSAITDNDITFTALTKYTVDISVSSYDKSTTVLDGKTITFTDTEDEDYTYSIEYNSGSENSEDAVTSITLRDGTYSVDVDVDYPYVRESFDELTVNGEDTQYSFTFTERLEWDFTDSSDTALESVTYQSTEEVEYNGLLVDTSNSGKFAVTSGTRVQINANTTVKIPVSGTGTVKIVTSSGYYNYSMTGTTKEASADNYQQSWDYELDESGYITLTADSQIYLYSITVTREESDDDDDSEYRTEWDFTDNSDGEWTDISIEEEMGTIAGGIKVDAQTLSSGGKFAYRADNGDVQINATTGILVPVAGNSKITITLATALGDSSVMTYGESGTAFGTDATEQTVTVKDSEIYAGTTGVNYIRLQVTTGTVYLQKIVITPIANETDPTTSVTGKNADGKPDVWDFAAGATAISDGTATAYIDTDTYNNMLTEDIINGWYDSTVTAGSSGEGIGDFSVTGEDGDTLLEFYANSKTNHRIRTKNTAITRYDEKSLTGTDGNTYYGYLYSNASGTGVYLGVYLEAGDVVTAVVSSNGGDSTIVFENIDDSTDAQTYSYVAGNAGIATFYATQTGEYKMYSTNEKLVVARLTVEKKDYVLVSGDVTMEEGTTEPSGTYYVQFTNDITGAVTRAKVKNGTYAAYLNEDYTYSVSLYKANGWVIKNDSTSFTLDSSLYTEDDENGKTYTYDVTVEAVNLVEVTGSITGLDAVNGGNQTPIKSVELTFANDDYIYIPEISIDTTNSTYSLSLESGVEYTVTADGVEDFDLSTASIGGYTEDTSDVSIEFAAKTQYDITLDLQPSDEISEDDFASASFVFARVYTENSVKQYEEDYVYTFTGTSGITLRDGQYEVTVANSPYTQKLTADLIVNGAAVTKTIKFDTDPITEWDFSDDDFTDVTNFKGLLMSGVSKNKTYALGGSGGKLQVPVAGDCTVKVYYCYRADGMIEDSVYITLTDGEDEAYGSTSITKSSSYTYTGDAGYVNISTSSTTYFTKITLTYAAESVDYKSTITVGSGDGYDYETINDALDAVASMDRTDNARVTIEIAPGDYEEMLVVDVPNVTLKNASSTPSIETKNKGVDIDDNAVRITSYYGHGYAYYSMGDDCKYDADVLAVNKANGAYSYENPGSGTTNGSYWNATVVIGASGFEAEGIIFENSFNQYVSAKAADDVIVALSGAKEGSTARADMAQGDTMVQGKSYVERAAALAIMSSCTQISFDNCKFIGRQDTLYGGTGVTAAFYDCSVYGGTDYIFGPMTAVFAKCDLVFNTDGATSTDVGYITASQTQSGRGYLMYNCTVTSTTPGVDTAAEKTSQAGYFGRPWQANTGEALFWRTIVETTDYSGETLSLITPAAWGSGLAGESVLSQEYGTMEKSGVDNSSKRAEWASVLTADSDGNVTLADETTIVTDDTVVAAFLSDWDAFSGKDMTIKTLTDDSEENPDDSGTETVEKPIADTASGSVAAGTIIKLTCATEGADIYYTMDGTDPTVESTQYVDGITIEASVTVKAIAIKGEIKSDISVYEYTVISETVTTIQLADCVISVPSVLYNNKAGSTQPSTTYVTYTYTDGSGAEKHVKFAEGLDYSAEWNGMVSEDNTTVYSVTLTGLARTADSFKIDSASTVTKTYRVVSKSDSSVSIVDISKAKVALDSSAKSAVYTGYAIEPGLDYSKASDLDGKLNVAYTNNINAGKATVTISAKETADTEDTIYVGSKTFTFTIKKAALNKNEAKATANVVWDEESFSFETAHDYTGTPITVTGLAVQSSSGRTLKQGTDYTVTYKNNTKSGKATVTVKGIGTNLSGSWTKKFTINPVALSELTFNTDGVELVYSPKGAKLTTLTAQKDGVAYSLTEGVDYKAKYNYADKKKSAGTTVDVTISGKGACTGKNISVGTFTIAQGDFADCITVPEDIAVDGKKLEKELAKAVTVTDVAGVKLKANKNYNTAIDTEAKTVTITPIDTANYKEDSSYVASYRIATNLAKDKNFVFNKQVTLQYDGRNPVELTADDITNYVGEAYKLGENIEIVEGTYKNNAKKGTASVTVKGIAGVDGGFYGTKTLKFKVVQ